MIRARSREKRRREGAKASKCQAAGTPGAAGSAGLAMPAKALPMNAGNTIFPT